jgi:Transglycosylase SLT domain
MRILLVCVTLLLVPQQEIMASEVPTYAPEPPIKQSSPLPQSVNAAGMVEAAPIDDTAVVSARAEPYSRQQLCAAVIAAARAQDLPISFFARLIWQESGFDTSAVSRVGAQGIAQFMPEVAAEMGIDDPFDPTQALPASAKLLRDLHRQFGNPGLAAAAYNVGSRRVRDWLAHRSRLPNETRSYVLNITGRSPEQWIGARQKNTIVVIPLGTRCQQAATMVAAIQSARWSRAVAKPRVIRVRAEPIAATETFVYKPDVY